MSLRADILALFEQVADEQDRSLVPLTDDVALLETGLDSLGFAIMVARLEDMCGFDPFDTLAGTEFPVTFGEFIRLDEQHPPVVG